MFRNFRSFSLFLLCLIALTSCSRNKQNSFLIDFTIDKQYDAQMIYVMLGHTHDPSGLKSRSKRMGIDLSLAQRISKMKSWEEASVVINELVNAKYEKVLPEMKKSVHEYGESWKSITAGFAEDVKEITGHAFFYPEYTCVVTAFHPGLSSWYGNEVARIYGKDPFKQRRITAHEIVLSHVFHIVRKYYTKEQIDDKKVWAIAEITTVFILNEPELMKFWPWSKDVTYLKNYNLKEQIQQLALFWKGKSDFRDYLDKVVSALNESS